MRIDQRLFGAFLAPDGIETRHIFLYFCPTVGHGQLLLKTVSMKSCRFIWSYYCSKITFIAKGKSSHVDTMCCCVLPLNSHTLLNSTTEFFFMIKRIRKHIYAYYIYFNCLENQYQTILFGIQTHFASSPFHQQHHSLLAFLHPHAAMPTDQLRTNIDKPAIRQYPWDHSNHMYLLEQWSG
jgi:hypothetical protein